LLCYLENLKPDPLTSILFSVDLLILMSLTRTVYSTSHTVYFEIN